jgi:hypothetical protein
MGALMRESADRASCHALALGQECVGAFAGEAAPTGMDLIRLTISTLTGP